MTSGQYGGWNYKLVLIWLTCLYVILCIAFIADLILILLLSGFSRWFCREANLLQPIRSTTQIWLVTRHQYGISAPRRHFEGKSVVASWIVGCFLRIYYLTIRLGDYSPIFTSPKATNCFSIVTLMIILENKSIVGFHMTSLKFKLKNCRSYRDFTFTMY